MGENILMNCMMSRSQLNRERKWDPRGGYRREREEKRGFILGSTEFRPRGLGKRGALLSLSFLFVHLLFCNSAL